MQPRPFMRSGLLAGVASIAAVAALQAFNSFACYGHSFAKYVEALGFIALPMLPALISLLTRNPIRAVGASAFFAPWLLVAYYVDCMRPYVGGGASMIYVAVVLLGLPSALVGAIVAGAISKQRVPHDG